MTDPQPVMNVPVETVGDAQFRSDVLRATEKIIEDSEVDDRLRVHPLWASATKTLKLTFLEGVDVNIFENMFEAEVCKYLRSIPPSKHNSGLYQEIGQIRMIFLANLRRSTGTSNRNRMNERIALVSLIKQIYASTSGVGSSGGGVKGFFGKLLGRK